LSCRGPRVVPTSPTTAARRLLLLLFFSRTAPPQIYPLSLHDALPISRDQSSNSSSAPAPAGARAGAGLRCRNCGVCWRSPRGSRSEEHTSELQSRGHLVCRLLLEKKK